MDERNNNILNHLHKMLGNETDGFHIMEERIGIETQMEYFHASQKEKENGSTYDIEEIKQQLNSPEVSNENKKAFLVTLANSENASAYTAIQEFNHNVALDLKEWSIMALNESKMQMESLFLEQNQIFISTGLGGKGNKLRYFLVLFHKNGKAFNKIQKHLIEGEFYFTLDKYRSEVEKVIFQDEMACLTVLVPIDQELKSLFTSIINDCNDFGNFIKEDFLVTNVKEMDKSEIIRLLEKEEDTTSLGE